MSGPGGVPGSGGCLFPGVSGPGRGVQSGGSAIPACTEADPPCEQNDRQVKKITLSQTSFAGSNKSLLNNCESCFNKVNHNRVLFIIVVQP